MIKVLVVDDHDLLRVGLVKLLSEQTGIQVVGEARDGEKAIAMVKEFKPNIVLMDLKMPGIGGIEATKRILRQHPDSKVLVITSCDEEPFPSRLLQAGASGFLSKSCTTEELLQAINKACNGQKYISPEVAQKMALKKVNLEEQNPFEKLSQRELQITLMICSGQTVADISAKLCLCSKTVNSYRYRIFEKLKVKNNVELTHVAIRYNILDQFNDDIELPQE